MNDRVAAIIAEEDAKREKADKWMNRPKDPRSHENVADRFTSIYRNLGWRHWECRICPAISRKTYSSRKECIKLGRRHVQRVHGDRVRKIEEAG